MSFSETHYKAEKQLKKVFLWKRKEMKKKCRQSPAAGISRQKNIEGRSAMICKAVGEKRICHLRRDLGVINKLRRVYRTEYTLSISQRLHPSRQWIQAVLFTGWNTKPY